MMALSGLRREAKPVTRQEARAAAICVYVMIHDRRIATVNLVPNSGYCQSGNKLVICATGIYFDT